METVGKICNTKIPLFSLASLQKANMELMHWCHVVVTLPFCGMSFIQVCKVNNPVKNLSSIKGGSMSFFCQKVVTSAEMFGVLN